VCSAFSRAYVEVDGGADPSEATARQRAAVRYGTPTLSAALDDPQSRSEEWPLLVEHRAIVVTTELPFEGQAPPDTSDRAYDAVVLDREAVGADGWRMRLPSVTIFCTSVRASDGWRVDKVDLSLGGTS
jgi:hypothetical protein